MSSEEFLLVADKFLESDASVVQLSTSFNEFLDEAKLGSGFFANKDKAIETETLLNCILKYLYCIIEYAGSGSAQARSATVRQLCNKICPAVEELKIKHEFIKNLSLPTFEILFGQPSWIAKEILRMYSDTIQDSDRAVRLEVVKEKGPYYLGRLMDAIAFGDFEFQVMIVETLYRICTKEILNDMPKVYFLTEELTNAFHKIDTDEFDLTVRNFLNLLNGKEKHVVSLLCNKVTFDDIQLQEPPELSSFKGMWVDFNVTAGTITFFLNNECFNKDIKWEMITVFPENISTTETSFAFNEERRKKEGTAKFILKGPCQLCYASAQHRLLKCRILTFNSIDTERFREVFNQVFPKIDKKLKSKQATTVSYKRAYKPLDIISLKSSATNPSTTFNMTIDSIIAGKRLKSKGGKSVTFADSTIRTDSSKSRSASSRKSLNISSNQSIETALEDISLMSYKMKNFRNSKRSAELDEISLNSKLSVLDLIHAGENVDKMGISKRIRLSGLEEVNNVSVHEHGTSRDIPYSKYSKKFLSNLMEMDKTIDMTLSRKGKSKKTQKEADSTTTVVGLYDEEIAQKEESIASDVFHSIEDIDNENIELSIEAEFAKNRSKKELIYGKLKRTQDNAMDKIIGYSKKSLSSVSADDYLDLKKDKVKKTATKRILYSKKKQEHFNTTKENTGVTHMKEKASILGVKLSPDLFCDSQESEPIEIMHTSKAVETTRHTVSRTNNVLFRSLLKMQEPSYIEPVRDCQLDEFDTLKLERPKEVLLEDLKDRNPPEPDLIQVSQPKYQSALLTETELFETAKTDLDNAEVEEIQWSGRNLELFQDISQENHNFQPNSQGESPEADVKIDEEYKSKIKVLADIQIQSPKSQFSEDASQKSQGKNSIFQSKHNRKPLQEIVMSSQNSHSKLMMKSPKTAECGKPQFSNETNIQTNEPKTLNKLGGIIARNNTYNKDQRQRVITAEMKGSRTQMNIPSDSNVLIEEKIDNKAISQDLQSSETQGSESSTTYQVKSSHKKGIPVEDKIENRVTSQDQQYSETQKTESQPPKYEVKTSKKRTVSMEGTIDSELSSRKLQYSKTEDTKSKTNLPKYVVRLSQKSEDISEENIESKAISQDQQYSETQKTESQSPKYEVKTLKKRTVSMEGTIDSEVSFQKLQYSKTHNTKSKTTLPKYVVKTSQKSKDIKEEHIDSKVISRENQYSETQKSESQPVPLKYGAKASKEEIISVEDTIDSKASSQKLQHSNTHKTKSKTTLPKHMVKTSQKSEDVIKEHIDGKATSQENRYFETQGETQPVPLKYGVKPSEEKIGSIDDTMDSKVSSQKLQYSKTHHTMSKTTLPKQEMKSLQKTENIIEAKMDSKETSQERKYSGTKTFESSSKYDMKTFQKSEIFMENKIHSEATSQDLQYSETQKSESLLSLPKSDVNSAQRRKDLIEKTIDSKAASQELQGSETQKTESSLSYEEKTSQKRIRMKDNILSKAIAQDQQHPGTQTVQPKYKVKISETRTLLTEGLTDSGVKSQDLLFSGRGKTPPIYEVKSSDKVKDIIAETIHGKETFSKLQKSGAQGMVSSPKYEVKSYSEEPTDTKDTHSWKKFREDENESLFSPQKNEIISQIHDSIKIPTNYEVESQKSQKMFSQAISSCEKTDGKKLHRENKKLKCSTQQKDKKKLQIENFVIKKNSENNSRYEESKEIIIDKKLVDEEARNPNSKSSCEDIVQDLLCTNEAKKKTRRKRRAIFVPKSLSRATSKAKKIRIQSDIPEAFVKLTRMPLKIEKDVAEISEMDDDDIPLSELKQLWKNETVDKNSKTIVGTNDNISQQFPTNNMRISPNDDSQEKVKMQIQANQVLTHEYVKLKNENIIIHNMTKITEKFNTDKNAGYDTEQEETDIPLSELKQILDGRSPDENTELRVYANVPLQKEKTLQVNVNEKSKEPLELHDDRLPQYKDGVDQRFMHIQEDGGLCNSLQSQKHTVRETEEDNHMITIHGNEWDEKYVASAGKLNNKMVPNSSVIKKKEDIGQKRKLKANAFGDNEPCVVEKSSPGCDIGSQKSKKKKQTKNYMPNHSETISPNWSGGIDERSLLNRTREVFDENHLSPEQKKNNHSKTGMSNNHKIKNDEVEKSLHLLFGTDVNNPVAECINPTSAEILDKNDKYLNLTIDTTNSIITGNVGVLKRGRKLFDPENKEENFLTCTIIDEEFTNNENEPKKIETQCKSDYRERIQTTKKNTAIQLDKEDHMESVKTGELGVEWQNDEQQKNKSKRCSDLQKKPHRPSKLDYIKYSRKRRFDAFYDKVLEKLKSEKSTPRKSYSVASKMRKNKNDSIGKYDLDFSTFRETMIEKRAKYQSRNSSTRRFRELKEGDGDASKEKNVIEINQDDTDETIRDILKGIGTLCQKIAQGKLKKPSLSIKKNLFAAADLLLEL